MRLELKNSKKEMKRGDDRLLVTGDGHCLEEDLRLFFSMWPESDSRPDIMAVGRSIAFLKDRFGMAAEHWANVDANEAKYWAEHLPVPGSVRHTIGEYEWMDADWRPEGELWDPEEVLWHGSSSLFAAYIGIEMGYGKITLAGCPLDRNGHWYDPKHTVRWTGETYQAWLDFAWDPRSKKVESLSGYTRQILEGRPGA